MNKQNNCKIFFIKFCKIIRVKITPTGCLLFFQTYKKKKSAQKLATLQEFRMKSEWIFSR